ncbi:MAG: TolA-binding protein [Myxococcota bacterium]|jgi:TolA-binding protein
MLCPAFLLFAFSADAFADERRVIRSDEVTDDQLREAYAQRARASHGGSVDFLKELIASTPVGERRAEMILRLAELHYEDARYYRFVVEDNEAADERLGAASRLYAHITETYPTHPRAAEAAFYLASAEQELDGGDEALAAWLQLVGDYPDSPYVPDAHVQIGEHYFDRGEVFKALQAYELAAQAPEARLRDYARHQAAWCYYNLGEYERAAQLAESVAAGGGEMRGDALSALARFSAEQHGDARALAPLGRLPLTDTERRTLTDGIAGILLEMGAAQDAMSIWGDLLSDDPDAAQAPDWLAQIADVHLQRTDHAAVLVLLSSPAAAQHPKVRASKLQALAVAAHRAGRAQGDREQLAIADAAYTRWLADPVAEHVLEVRYAHAELLYALGRYAEAYEAYRTVAASDSERAAFCAEAAAHAARALLEAEEEVEVEGTERLVLSAAAGRYLEAADALVSRGIDAPMSLKVAYRAAYILYQHNHLPESAERFLVVIEADPTSSEAELAAHLVMDGLALQEQWVALRDTARRLGDIEGLGEADFAAQAQAIYEGAAFKVVEQAPSADAWTAYAQEHPDAPLAAAALNNAAVAHHRDHRRAEAIVAREALLALHPASLYAPDQLAALGHDKESIADFLAAAALYEQLSASHPEHPAAADALLSAAIFRRSLEQSDRAVEDFMAFAERYPQDDRAPGALLEAGALHREAGALDDAVALHRRFVSSPPENASAAQRQHAWLALGVDLDSLGQPRAAAQAWSEASAGEGVVAAEARFRLAEQQRAAYWALRLDRVDEVAEQTQAMVAGLGVLEEDYGAVIAAGGLRWGLQAAVRLGGAYEHFAAQLLESPVPDLTVTQRQIYVEKVEDLAWMMSEKAATVYREVLRQSFAQHRYDESTAEALGRLQALDPSAYPALTEELIRASFTTSGAAGMGLLESPE